MVTLKNYLPITAVGINWSNMKNLKIYLYVYTLYSAKLYKIIIIIITLYV